MTGWPPTVVVMTTTTTPSAAEAAPADPSPHVSGGRIRRTALTALAPAVWGTTYLVTTELLPADRPLTAALLRALPGGLLALVLTRARPRGSWWWRALALGSLNVGAFFPLLFVSAEHLPGGVAATLGATQPLLVVLLATVLLGERLSLWRVVWAVLGALGVALVVLGPEASLDPVGVVAGIGGAGAMAVGVVLTARWGRPEGVGPVSYAGWQLTAGGLVLLAPTLAIEGPPPPMDLPALGGYLWLATVGGIVAYALWFSGLRVLPVTSTALLGLLSPIVAVALGALVVDESLTWIQLGGAAMALTALAAGQLSPAGHRAGAR